MEPQDLELLFDWENDSAHWWMGATNLPISREAMRNFIAGNHDVYRDRQLRWMLDAQVDEAWQTIGALDLYDVDPRHLRAGTAIHIVEPARRQGHGLEGLRLLKAYAHHHLGLRQVYAEIPSGHVASEALFGAAGFEMSGMMASWIRSPHGWKDVSVWQCLFDKPCDP
ncbi:MAG: GNAT family N-acetyltransferase [Bacteroidetes bacterium]|nr:GNAT family N-acetyltransferase [Bacteroidota bacterium]